jgi:hypothetical protein
VFYLYCPRKYTLLIDEPIQVVGRGGQILLSLVSYLVFARYITSTMAVEPVSFATYKTIFFRDGPNTESVFTLLREFIVSRALHSKVAMVWMILSAGFVAFSPTWVSAMTGYSGNTDAFFPDFDGGYGAVDQFLYIEYVIHDGDRIGKTTDFYITGNVSGNSLNGKTDSTP